MHVPLRLNQLADLLQNQDIYLLDQILKGRIREGMAVLDAGCGDGRNSKYLMQAGIEVYGADISAESILRLQAMASAVAPHLPAANFITSDLDALSFATDAFDVVICSAVLHFARDEAHFRAILSELWRVLKPGGMFFCRLSTTIGQPSQIKQVQGYHYLMPHGQVWFLADEKLLRETTATLRAVWLEPLKSVLVEQERSMTTWVLQKA
ncbi:class I SAM-dependent methyltransferase [Pontibacter sp. CAU 1760]